MSKPNTKVIGAFVTASIVLLFGMVFFFSSTSLFSRNEQFILFFDQSVNGLTVGSSVKFRGVPIGAVERIMIRAEGQHPDSSAIPVIINIDRDRLEKNLGVMEQTFEPEAIMSSIRDGLYAQLTLESLITGQLFIEFTMDAERSPGMQWHLVQVGDILEIPTLSSSLDEITADAADIIGHISQLDIPRLEENVNQVLISVSTMLDGLDTEGISKSVTDAADEITDFVASEELEDVMLATASTLNKLTETLATYDLEDGPLAETVGVWTATLTETLTGLDELTAHLTAMTDPSSGMRYEFESALRELARAARSIRALSDYLEKNPKALITGRPE